MTKPCDKHNVWDGNCDDCRDRVKAELAMYRKQITLQDRAIARYKRTLKLMESAHKALMIERDNLLTARIGSGTL